MRLALRLSIMQQVSLCLAISVVSALSWFFLPLYHLKKTPYLTVAFTLFALTVMGSFIASLWLTSDLRNGIESERWPVDQIEQFRAVIDTSLSRFIFATVTIAAVFFVLFDFPTRHRSPSGYGLLMLSQTLSQLQMAARRPKPRDAGRRIDWRSAPPITSDHWGEP